MHKISKVCITYPYLIPGVPKESSRRRKFRKPLPSFQQFRFFHFFLGILFCTEYLFLQNICIICPCLVLKTQEKWGIFPTQNFKINFLILKNLELHLSMTISYIKANLILDNITRAI